MSLEWVLLGFRILATIVLYTFLGLAFYIVWRDLKRAGVDVEDLPGMTHRLRVTAPAEDGAPAIGDILPLQPITCLGRDPENTIVIRYASVSTRHARLRWINGVWWLEDLGSRNGTRLNGLPLSKPAPLANGDIIGIGEVRLKLEST